MPALEPQSPESGSAPPLEVDWARLRPIVWGALGLALRALPGALVGFLVRRYAS